MKLDYLSVKNSRASLLNTSAVKYLTRCLALAFLTNTVTAQECTVIHNIKGVTPTNDSKEIMEFDWLAFSGGQVIDMGVSDIPPAYKSCQKYDGKARFVLPGLIDAHGHVSSLGQELLSVSLRGVGSEQEAVDAVAKFSKENPTTPWILGRGWNQVLWPEKKFPSRKTLDAIESKKPVMLERIDAHAVWVNSAALEAAGITDSTPDPLGGKIERDSKGVATGILIDNAMNLVIQKIPALGQGELDMVFDKAFDHLLSLGITSVHDAGVSKADLDVYLQRQVLKRLPLRIYGMLSGTSPYLDMWLEKGPIETSDDFLSIRSVKLYSDGALGSRGAALLAPYSDDPGNRGLLLTEPKKLNAVVEKIMAAGFQANIHAIGDRGNRLVLDAIEAAYKNTEGRKLRHRIEHAQVVSVKDIPRFKTLDIIASMQPTHATSDKNMAADRIGMTRLKGAYAWQTFLQQGVIIASGSDFPVEYANPFFGLHAAVTRQDQSNEPKGGWLAGEKMTIAQALRSFTVDAAYAGHQEKKIGSLEPGKWADFIVVDTNILAAKPSDLWKTQVIETWVAGKMKYQHPTHSKS